MQTSLTSFPNQTHHKIFSSTSSKTSQEECQKSIESRNLIIHEGDEPWVEVGCGGRSEAKVARVPGLLLRQPPGDDDDGGGDEDDGDDIDDNQGGGWWTVYWDCCSDNHPPDVDQDENCLLSYCK